MCVFLNESLARETRGCAWPGRNTCLCAWPKTMPFETQDVVSGQDRRHAKHMTSCETHDRHEFCMTSCKTQTATARHEFRSPSDPLGYRNAVLLPFWAIFGRSPFSDFLGRFSPPGRSPKVLPYRNVRGTQFTLPCTFGDTRLMQNGGGSTLGQPQMRNFPH